MCKYLHYSTEKMNKVSTSHQTKGAPIGHYFAIHASAYTYLNSILNLKPRSADCPPAFRLNFEQDKKDRSANLQCSPR
jgi:hypothetical protein